MTIVKPKSQAWTVTAKGLVRSAADLLDYLHVMHLASPTWQQLLTLLFSRRCGRSSVSALLQAALYWLCTVAAERAEVIIVADMKIIVL